MRTNFHLALACISILLLSAGCVSRPGRGYTVGGEYHGFRLIEKRFVPEFNAECLHFEHVRSGAQLVKVMADDPNKTFSIAFRTVPDSDCGTAHILEHSILNGSKNFPVKSPFEELMKGSLNTFLNAWTASDNTVYPVASMNEKDYFNLMHVYLDAVFYPMIYKEPRILMQEGWHYELAGRDAPLKITGVVYNEMKGVFSSPGSIMNILVRRELFPDNSYRFFSGGVPSAIPGLTDEKFLDFHRRHYRPDNSLILLYGDADLGKELEFIGGKYLSEMERASEQVSIPLQKPFDKMRERTASYPVPEGGSTKGQTYLSLSFVAGTGSDRTLVMGLGLLADLLVNKEAAPIRQALQEAGVGKEFYAYADDSQQNIFTIVAKNADSGDKDKFKAIVFKALADAAANGFDKEMLEGAVNRLEFHLREGNDAYKGLACTGKTITGWLYCGNPLDGLGFEKQLAEIKNGPPEEYLKGLLSKYVIGNNHKLLLVLQPEQGLEKKETVETAEKLAKYKAGLSNEQISSLIAQTGDLKKYQEAKDSPEALGCLPSLGISDIDPKAEWFECDVGEAGGAPLLHREEFTNGVVFANLYFDMRVLPQRLIPYAVLLSSTLGSLGTERHSYKSLDNQLNIHTGGFGAGISGFLEKRDDTRLIPKFNVSCKALNSKMDSMFALAEEILNRTRFDDKERLRTLIARSQAGMDSSIRSGKLDFPMTRLLSYFSDAGMFNETTGGLEYYWFISDLSKDFDAKAGEISADLAETARLLFTRENMTAAATCAKGDLANFRRCMEGFAGRLRSARPQMEKWSFKLEKKNEALAVGAKVQSIVKGYNFKRLGYAWDGKMHVLRQILTRDWLHKQIRVQGGAYGAAASFSQTGNSMLFSFSDPNLEKTVRAFDETPSYLEKFDPDGKEMTRYIIGTISGLDRPLTPSDKGQRAFQYYFEKTELRELQRDRDAILSTTPADIRGMKSMVADVLKQDALCASGGEVKIKSEAGLFKSVLNPLK